MIGFLRTIFSRAAPTLSRAAASDARALAMLHAGAFSRGWSEEEFETLLIDRMVVTHVARMRRSVVGFIMSRVVEDEAEILSVAVSPSCQGRGIARQLLMLNLRTLAGHGVREIFLEVEENNRPARKLYDRNGFVQVGHRAAYYKDAGGHPAAALVMQRQLA
jgi:ribosomal-protein-alanine N-acetyltransferase